MFPVYMVATGNTELATRPDISMGCWYLLQAKKLLNGLANKVVAPNHMAHSTWSKDKITQLIELLHDAPALWDIKSKEFHDREKKSEEMQNISSRLNVSEEEVAKKIKSIKTQYRREYTKQLQHERSGLTSSRDKEWFGYKPLSFLRKNISSKEVDSPDQEDSGDDDKEDKDDAKSSDSSTDTENPITICPEKTYSKANVKKERVQSPASNSHHLKRKIHDELFNQTSKSSPPPDQGHPYRWSCPDVQANGQQKQVSTKRNDDLSIYGENVASRMRNSMQGYREIAIARHEIDKILFKLEMGEFR